MFSYTRHILAYYVLGTLSNVYIVVYISLLCFLEIDTLKPCLDDKLISAATEEFRLHWFAISNLFPYRSQREVLPQNNQDRQDLEQLLMKQGRRTGEA